MKRHKTLTRTTRPWNMTAAAAAMLMVTSAAFGIDDTAPTQSKASQDALFLELDADRDGVVSRAEAARMPRFAKVFDEADDNRDGRLTPGEFVKARSIHQRALIADYGRDSVITAKVKAALIRDPAVGGVDVGVKTYDGVVLLSGKVADQAAAERARTLARNVRGVTDVRDEFVTVR